VRVDSGDKSHVVAFASRDWKLLLRESRLPIGRHWLQAFGFFGPPGSTVAQGLQVGYEFTGDRMTMLNDSKALLAEILAFAADPNPPSSFQGSIRPRSAARPQPFAWPEVLPPLIQFLSELEQDKVKIYNHHR
jgi:hypothetical protein